MYTQMELTIIFHFILLCSFLYTSRAVIINGHDPKCTTSDEPEFDFEICENATAEYYCTLTPDKQCWLHSLYQEAIKEIYTTPRIRREIRTLTDKERQAFFKAINELKEDRSVEPNKYDALALLHTNRTLCSVHKGSNFLGWHRIYMLLFETALRQKDKSVVLPYWASTIDNNNVTLPNETVMFTDAFLGNGHGNVISGPFKNWRDIYHCTIERDIDNRTNDVSLPSPEIVSMIEHNKTILEVALVTAGNKTYQPDPDLTIEGQHNLLHDWVGGMMGILDSSPKDPTFFLHHAYVDYIWEKFRQKQIAMKINPETDYPGFGDARFNLHRLHAPNRTMDCFFWMTNFQGYWNNFTENLYTYEDMPDCPSCGNSRFLTCSPELQRCIGTNGTDETKSTSSSAIHNKSPYASLLFFVLMVTVWF